MRDSSTHESGNILIYVIIAIFLFGALIAILRGGGSQQNIDAESTLLKVKQVREYAGELERGVQIILQNGHAPSEIRFAHPNHTSAYGDLSADTPFTRQIFHPSGGNVTWRDNDPDIQETDTNWVFNRGAMVLRVGNSTGTRSQRNDLMAVLPHVTSSFCAALNDAIGVPNQASGLPHGYYGIDNSETAVYDGSNTMSAGQVNTSPYFGQLEGCGQNSTIFTAGSYNYYKILLPF